MVSSARSWKPKQKKYEDKSPSGHFYSWSESRERGQRSLRGGFVVGRQEERESFPWILRKTILQYTGV